MRTPRLSLVSLSILLLCTLTSGCYFLRQIRSAHLPTVISVTEECTLVDETGNAIEMPISVWPGSKFLWKNHSHRGVAIKFDDPRIMSRGEKFYMAPGETVLTRFRSDLAEQETRFVVICKNPLDDEEDDESEGSVDHDGGKGPSPDPCDPNNPKYDENACN